MRRLLTSLFVFAATLLVVAPARATAEFPSLIISHLKIACDGGASPLWDGQGCTICHLSNGGGLGTVQHPFGVQMKSLGVSAFNDTALTAALDQMPVDCNGNSYVAELEACQWQSIADLTCEAGAGGGDAAILENVIYGCSTATAPAGTTPPNDSTPLSIAAVMGGMLVVGLVRRRLSRSRA